MRRPSRAGQLRGDIRVRQRLGPGDVVVSAGVPGLGEGDGRYRGYVAGVDHADPCLPGVGVEGPRCVDGRNRRLGDVLQEQVGPHDHVRQPGILEIAVAAGMRADELGRGLPVGAEDRAAHQQLHLRPAGGVDGVAVPADRVGVRAGEQEHLVDSRHRRDQRALVGQVAGDRLGPPRADSRLDSPARTSARTCSPRPSSSPISAAPILLRPPITRINARSLHSGWPAPLAVSRVQAVPAGCRRSMADR